MLYAIAQPVPPDQGLWDRAEIAASARAKLQERIHAAARNAAHLVPNGNSGFGGLVHWHAEGADASRMSSEYEEPPGNDAGNYMTAATVNIDGRAVLYSPGSSQVIVENAQDTNPLKYIFEPHIAGSVVAFLAAVGELYAAARYYGAVDRGVVVVGLQGGVGVAQFARSNMPRVLARRHATAYNAPAFTRVHRLSAASELADAQAVTVKLVGRLLKATSLREDYSPLRAPWVSSRRDARSTGSSVDRSLWLHIVAERQRAQAYSHTLDALRQVMSAGSAEPSVAARLDVPLVGDAADAEGPGGRAIELDYRVLTVDGRMPDAFRSAGRMAPADPASALARLESEGARVDGQGRAAQQQRFSATDWIA